MAISSNSEKIKFHLIEVGYFPFKWYYVCSVKKGNDRSAGILNAEISKTLKLENMKKVNFKGLMLVAGILFLATSCTQNDSKEQQEEKVRSPYY